MRLAVVSAASALVLSGLAGTASAEPVNPDGPAGPNVNLTAEQQQQLQDALDARASSLPASGPMAFLLELETPSTGQVFAENLPRGQGAAAAAVRAAISAITNLRGQVLSALPQAASQFTELYRTQATLAGLAIETDVSNFAALSSIPGVRAVYPISPKKIDNAGAAQLTRAAQVWSALGNTGEGVTVGIVDTGLDYVHTDFGGPGTPAAYAVAQRDAVTPPARLFPNAKVVGGYDFVGDAYNADSSDPAYSPVRHPDNNPMDCNGHGSHVAGSAAGYGVNADGSTFAGPYDANVPLRTMRIGPGMAPEAQLFALRVFGCEGSTNATALALEYSMDPNQDGLTDDHLDVVNLSLGSDFGLPDDGDAVIVNRAAELGVSMVLSAGNAGDTFDIGGSPGNAARAITVAATNDGFGVFDGWRIVNKPELFDPDIRPGLRSVAYTTPTPAGVRGELAVPIPTDDETACTPLDGDYTGKFLIIEADGFACGSVTKSGNAAAAGATGFVIVSDDDLLETGITGSAVIPGILVTASDGEVLKDEVAAGEELIIEFGDNLKDASVFVDPDQEDLLASFSSRGVRQANGAKPDVAAPGVTLYSAATGTGNQGTTISGTSMASPTTAGVVALIRSAHPTWTTEEVKATVMNTANEDVYTGLGQTGDIYGPNRVGAGRIDALDALNTKVVAYVQDAPGVVSASFGVIEATSNVTTMTRTIRVVNKGTTAQTMSVAYDAITTQPGVSYSLNKSSVTVGPGGSTTVVLTITVNRSQLRKTLDPTMTATQEDSLIGFGELPRQFVADASGRVVLTASAAGSTQPELRVPVHANAKPSSTLTQSLSSFTGNTARLTLSGRGVANGPLGAPSSYVSLSSAFEQLGTSPQMAKCSRTVKVDCYKSELERSVDLKAIGVATDAPFTGTVLQPLRNSYLYFGVAAHGKFTTPDAVIGYSVFIDGDGDNVPDYEIFSQRLANGADGIDVVLVLGAYLTGPNAGFLMETPDGNLAAEFLNIVPGDVDTNFFDNDTVIMPFPISSMPLLTRANPRFTFGVQATSFGYGTIDTVGTTPFGKSVAGGMSFNARTPGLSFSSGGEVAQLVVSGPGTTIDVRRNSAQLAADRAVGGPKGILMIHSHNSTAAGRAQTVAIPGVT